MLGLVSRSRNGDGNRVRLNSRLEYTAFIVFFFSSRRRHTRCSRDWSSDVCSSDLPYQAAVRAARETVEVVAAFDPEVVVADILTVAAALAAEMDGRPWGTLIPHRSEERRVGKEGRSRWSPYH